MVLTTHAQNCTAENKNASMRNREQKNNGVNLRARLRHSAPQTQVYYIYWKGSTLLEIQTISFKRKII